MSVHANGDVPGMEQAGGDTSASEHTLREHLVRARLAGEVQTSESGSLANCARLVDGDPDCAFGLSDWRTADYGEIVGAVRALAGDSFGRRPRDARSPATIEPELALVGLRRQRDALIAFVAAGGGRVLLATGHPGPLLAHYGAIAAALATAGCQVLTPLDGRTVEVDGRRRGTVHFSGGVGSVHVEGRPAHTHRADPMEALLAACGSRPPDLVIGDHGFAGAAIEAGVETLSIADVNDPGLPLAQARGRTSGVLMIDDGLVPAAYGRVTAALLAPVAGAAARR